MGSTAAALFDEFYEWRLEDSPELATMVGDHRYDDKVISPKRRLFPVPSHMNHVTKSFFSRKARGINQILLVAGRELLGGLGGAA